MMEKKKHMKNKRLERVSAISFMVIQLFILTFGLWFCDYDSKSKIILAYICCTPLTLFTIYLSFMVGLGKFPDWLKTQMNKSRGTRMIALWLIIFGVWILPIYSTMVIAQNYLNLEMSEVTLGILFLPISLIGAFSWILAFVILLMSLFKETLTMPTITGPYSYKDLDIVFANYSQRRLSGESDLDFRKRVFKHLITKQVDETGKKALLCILFNIKDLASLPRELIDHCIPMFGTPIDERDIDSLLSHIN
ncbi:hypothetical protein A3J61_02155 [Candidatus Nomurabacteria bacterium RIFCSPHIGHO2_02_FULL_38_15]|uniref:Uncharacterized protein n=1 Tax=Candidatus Nomurabacteria bacterium RIFCSPHIGHO2_02_FULL_38_15 TaxID=1801752 RepID=A0A1F6VRM1_9BACT|nr:MAG: hypothetical protein A3J61_02155 [Candidatus Nomurabacteria bacterium RIFCSPHIGHO2_02_FULL_38_15]